MFGVWVGGGGGGSVNFIVTGAGTLSEQRLCNYLSSVYDGSANLPVCGALRFPPASDLVVANEEVEVAWGAASPHGIDKTASSTSKDEANNKATQHSDRLSLQRVVDEKGPTE